MPTRKKLRLFQHLRHVALLAMQQNVLAPCHHLEIFGTVVFTITIEVMDNLVFSEFTPEHFFCDNAMLMTSSDFAIPVFGTSVPLSRSIVEQGPASLFFSSQESDVMPIYELGCRLLATPTSARVDQRARISFSLFTGSLADPTS